MEFTYSFYENLLGLARKNGYCFLAIIIMMLAKDLLSFVTT